MIWFVLLIVAAVMGVVIYFAMKSHNKMVADGSGDLFRYEIPQ